MPVPREQLESLLIDGPIPCTLSFPAADGQMGLRRSRVLSVDDAGVRVQTAAADRDGINGLIAKAGPILVTVRATDHERIFFAPPVSITEPHAEVDHDVVQLAMPEKLLETQRRSYFRVPIGHGDDVHLRLWRIGDYIPIRDRPKPSQELLSELLDIGAGGMRVAVHARGLHALGLVQDQRFRAEIISGTHEMIFEGRLRHPNATLRDDIVAVCGIRFVHRENVESRANQQKLQALLATLQRKAVRRKAA